MLPVFGVANTFGGGIAAAPGVLVGRWCFDPFEDQSPGSAKPSNRWGALPDLHDDAVIAENLERWLSSD